MCTHIKSQINTNFRVNKKKTIALFLYLILFRSVEKEKKKMRKMVFVTFGERIRFVLRSKWYDYWDDTHRNQKHQNTRVKIDQFRFYSCSYIHFRITALQQYVLNII